MDTLPEPIDWPPRWSPEWVSRRAVIEQARRERLHSREPAPGGLPPAPYRIFAAALRAAGLYQRGYRNFLDLGLTRIRHCPSPWPRSLDGLRILHLSDLHLDLDPALVPVTCSRIAGVPFDLAVLTGDFWDISLAEEGKTLAGLQAILAALGNPPLGVHAVLGNHDTLQLAAGLETLGLGLLINEAVLLGDGDSRFALAGIDDAYAFGTGSVKAAARACPPGLPRILLSHSPQVAEAAREAGFCLMLSGHTHGGQICLPGGLPLVTMTEIPAPLFRGLWRAGPLAGYTSTGAGACHLPLRFNCPPEIVLHSLHALPG
ncbi:MAG: metallophosphoesterase family protein [Oceanipulchritudo sp.]